MKGDWRPIGERKREKERGDRGKKEDKGNKKRDDGQYFVVIFCVQLGKLSFLL